MRSGVDCKGKEWEEIELSSHMFDATNVRFNNLVALFPVISENKKQWLCRCDCGNETVVAYAYLKSGKTKSCGCLKNKFGETYWVQCKDGKHPMKYGKLTVVDYLGSINGFATYRFRCDCGNIVDIPMTYVAGGNTRSCGCLHREKTTEHWHNYREEKNIIGQKFGRLTIVGFVGIKDGKSIYKFQCDCGNFVEYPIIRVKSGNTNSCGCLWSDWNDSYKTDLIGQRFGKLVVKSFAGVDKHGSTTFECQCDCGNTTVVNRYALLDNRTHSCGCINSVGESNIKKILNSEHIKYKYQQTFSDLRSDADKELQYDFGILSDEEQVVRLIEFDGPQHNEPIDHFGGEERLIKQQYHDLLKNQYALSHNIPLVRVPYDKRDSMTLEDLLGPKYLI